MDLQQLLASLLNPNGSQQAMAAPMGAAAQVGDHANPALLQQSFAQAASVPQQMPQAAPPAPVQAPQAPMGQPMQPSAPQPAPAPSGGLGGFLQHIIARQAAGRNKTVGWLTTQGLDQGTATVLASDKGALRSYILQKAKGGGLTEFDQRAEAARQYGLDPTTPEGRNFILSGKLPEARGGTAELGLQPQYGVDAQGNPVIIQIGKDGKAVQTQMPAGVQLSKQPIKLDAGTQWILLDPITRQPVGQIPKDIAGVQAQEAFGKAKGAAAFDLPRIEQNAQQTIDVINQLETHPGRGTATGASGTFDPRNYIAGTDATNFKVLLDQAKGQVFLQAYNTLKGGGQITEVEGKKAQDAIARLNTAQSDDEFTKALGDFKTVIQTGLERARQQAGVPASATPSTAPAGPSSSPAAAPKAAPSVGEVRYGYRFKGGDPSEPSNWEKAPQ
jgi:hypothetical protein